MEPIRSPTNKLFCTTADGSILYEGAKRTIVNNNVEIKEECIDGQLKTTRTPLSSVDVSSRRNLILKKFGL